MESTYCFKCGTASAPPSSSAHTEVSNPASSLASGAELTSRDKPYQALNYFARSGGPWAPRWASWAVQGSCRWPFPSLPALSPSACLPMHGLPCSQGDEVTAHGSRGPTVSYTISPVHFLIAHTRSVEIMALQSAQQERPRHGRSRSLGSCGAPREHRPGSLHPLR